MATVVAQPHFMFGLRTGVTNNLCFFDEETVIFPCGNNCVRYNIVQRCQRFIPGRLNGCWPWWWNSHLKLCETTKYYFWLFLSVQAQRKAKECVLWPSAPTGGTWQCQSAVRRPPSQCMTCSMSKAGRGKFWLLGKCLFKILSAWLSPLIPSTWSARQVVPTGCWSSGFGKSRKSWHRWRLVTPIILSPRWGIMLSKSSFQLVCVHNVLFQWCFLRSASTLSTTHSYVWVELAFSSSSATQREPWNRTASQRWRPSTSCVIPGWQRTRWSLVQTQAGCWCLSLASCGEKSVRPPRLHVNSLTGQLRLYLSLDYIVTMKIVPDKFTFS